MGTKVKDLFRPPKSKKVDPPKIEHFPLKSIKDPNRKSNIQIQKLPTIPKIPKSQSKNYGNYTKYTIKMYLLNVFKQFQTYRMCFGIVGVFCIISCYFEYRIRIRCI